MNDEIRMIPQGGTELPEGWVRAPFSAVTVETIQRVPGEKEKITYIDIGSVARDTKTIVEPQTMLGKDAPSRARKVIQTGDVLVSTVRPNLNAVALVQSQYDGQFASTGFDVLRSTVVDSRWLFYSVRTPEFLDRMSELVQGALYPAVRSKDIRSFVIPIAPLPEQKRIADKLDALLGRVDACRARLDRVPALLKRFRQSVLAAAMSGRLTTEWRKENSITIEPPTSIDPPDGFSPVPEGWQWRSLESICESVVDCPHTTPKWTEKGRLCVRTTNFKPGFLDLSTVQFVSDETFNIRNERVTPKPGDILYSREGGILGIACMIPDGVELCLGQRMMLLRVKAGFRPEMLMHWLNSPTILQRVRELTGGTASPHLNVRDIRAFPVATPSLPEQQEIVRRVEALFAFADRIEARLATAQKTVERLTPATLAKAFRGELVPQDPNDEPASVLLERLKSAAPEPSSKKQRRSKGAAT